MEAVIKRTSNQSLLHLPKSAKSMEGWYQCIAENEAGEEYSNSTLHVLGLLFLLRLLYTIYSTCRVLLKRKVFQLNSFTFK